MNWTRLQELRDEVGADAFGEVLASFLEETDATAARLAQRQPDGGLEDDVHCMKGAALNLGLEELAAACATAETRARAQVAGTAEIDMVLDCYARARTEIVREAAALAPGMAADA